MLADKAGDLANIAAGALIFGQAVSECAFSLVLGLAGLAAWIALIIGAIVLKGGRPWSGPDIS